jgi:hydrogenase maturation protease
VTALDGGTGGLGLLQLLEGPDRVVIVDAADVGQKPGQFVRFEPAEARLVGAGDGFALHEAGLSEVLALAGALGRTLPDLVVFGVQPAEVGWKDALSPTMESVLPTLVDAVLNELKGDSDAEDSGDRG